MNEQTVTGKAAWDALGEGKMLHYLSSPWGLQIRYGRLTTMYDDGRVGSSGHKTFARLLAEEWHVRPRVGDALIWGNE